MRRYRIARKFRRLKFLQVGTNLRKPRKFYPTKLSSYTVFTGIYITDLCLKLCSENNYEGSPLKTRTIAYLVH